MAPQRLLVVQRHQRQRRDARGGCETGARHCHVGPQPRPVVVVEHDHRAARAQARRQSQQPLAAGRRQDRQADAAEVQRVDLRRGFLQRRAGGIEVRPRGGLVAPVAETPFPAGLQFDQVQPRHPVRQPPYQVDAQAFGAPALDQPVAEAVGAQRGGVIDAKPALTFSRTTTARQIHSGVECVAAEALAHGAEGFALQLEHALTETHHARGAGHRQSSISKRCFGIVENTGPPALGADPR